jgi:hypothetical protein
MLHPEGQKLQGRHWKITRLSLGQHSPVTAFIHALPARRTLAGIESANEENAHAVQENTRIFDIRHVDGRDFFGARPGYLPMQSISYEFGSKAMSGYFVPQGSVCLVTFMISDRSDPDRPSPATAARVRLVLEPGQIAGLDSEEGRSLNLTCGGGAKTLVVSTGERSKLVAQQGVAVQNTIADRVQERR